MNDKLIFTPEFYIDQLKQNLEQIELLEKTYANNLESLRRICKHEILLEAPRLDQEYFSDLHPIRICEICGMEEESSSSWSNSYKYLTGRAYSVKRDGPGGIYATRRRGGRCLAREFYKE